MSGVTHWWRQRLSSLVLIPLSLWLLWSGASVAGASHAGAAAFLAHPLNALFAALTVAAAGFHAQSGIQVIVEDYVPGAAFQATLIWATRAACALGTLGLWWALWRVLTGGAA